MIGNFIIYCYRTTVNVNGLYVQFIYNKTQKLDQKETSNCYRSKIPLLSGILKNRLMFQLFVVIFVNITVLAVISKVLWIFYSLLFSFNLN